VHVACMNRVRRSRYLGGTKKSFAFSNSPGQLLLAPAATLQQRPYRSAAIRGRSSHLAQSAGPSRGNRAQPSTLELHRRRLKRQQLENSAVLMLVVTVGKVVRGAHPAIRVRAAAMVIPGPRMSSLCLPSSSIGMEAPGTMTSGRHRVPTISATSPFRSCA